MEQVDVQVVVEGVLNLIRILVMMIHAPAVEEKAVAQSVMEEVNFNDFTFIYWMNKIIWQIN